MSWRFVGRSEQIERIRAALRDDAPGPIVITGESGVGRTAVLSRALESVDSERDSIIHIHPSGDAPFAALRPYLTTDFQADAPLSDSVRSAARALTERADGRRLIVALDDAHLADHASVLTLRALSRQGDAVLVVTQSISADHGQRPDPTDSLRYERGTQTLCLPPLSIDEVAAVLTGVIGGHVHPATTEALHAATGGKPRLLYDLVVGCGLAECMVTRNGMWRLGDAPGTALPQATDGAARLVGAARHAWRELNVERADELCRLAVWRGASEQIAAVWANVLLLRGRAQEGIRLLDSLPHTLIEQTAELALIKALTLALGLSRADLAGDFLLRATSHNTHLRDRLLAYRAWILAVTHRVDKAAHALDGVDRGDRETAVFVHATRAAVVFAAGNANQAVFHLRRALATAEGCVDAPPWMAPYLTACLIDALLLAGRSKEATTTASGFHGGEQGSGWEIAVAFSALTTAHQPAQLAKSKVPAA
jgi:hypothetical protein